MLLDLNKLSSAEQAVAKTLSGWGSELDNDEKFRWMNWSMRIRDVVTAMRMGEPVLYDDDEDD